MTSNISDKELNEFQITTNKVLREYCIINIENLESRILMLKKQIDKMTDNDPALKISTDLLENTEKELQLYREELKYLDS